MWWWRSWTECTSHLILLHMCYNSVIKVLAKEIQFFLYWIRSVIFPLISIVYLILFNSILVLNQLPPSPLIIIAKTNFVRYLVAFIFKAILILKQIKHTDKKKQVIIIKRIQTIKKIFHMWLFPLIHYNFCWR